MTGGISARQDRAQSPGGEGEAGGAGRGGQDHFATATILAAMRWRQDYYLFLIGAAAFTAATIGYQHRRRHLAGDTGHIAGMGIACVAMLTAFYVGNGPHLPLWDRLPTFAFWLLPSAIGAPVIIRAILGSRHAPAAPDPPGDDRQPVVTLTRARRLQPLVQVFTGAVGLLAGIAVRTCVPAPWARASSRPRCRAVRSR